MKGRLIVYGLGAGYIGNRPVKCKAVRCKPVKCKADFAPAFAYLMEGDSSAN